MAINTHMGEYPIYAFTVTGPSGTKGILVAAPPGEFLNDTDMDDLMADFKTMLLARSDVTSAPATKYDESHMNF
ncbi:hypothetical protein [Streptomyces sp. NPDC002088]|uniref:hypothetical protein n=1 Tax=Streptomyces sp. NPDC002088 TaxID=3154665 RepID=UPI0033254CB8